MPAKEVSYKNAAQNTVRKSLSRKDRIEIVVKKVSYKIAAQNTVESSLLKKDRHEMLVK